MRYEILGCVTHRIIRFIAKEFSFQSSELVTWLPVFQASGILLYFSLDNEPSAILSILFIGTTALLAAFFHNRFSWAIPIMFCALGFTCAHLKTMISFPKEKVLSRKTYVKDAIGTLKEIDYRPGYVQLMVCNVKTNRLWISCTRLSARTEIDDEIKIGDYIRFSGVLYPPAMAISEHGYDFAKVAYFKQISAVGFTISRVVFHEGGKNITTGDRIERLRLAIYRRLVSGLEHRTAEVMAALLVGKRRGIDGSTLQEIRDSGLSHLFAISGLHLSFVSGMIFVFFRNAFSISEILTLCCNTKKIASAIALAASVFYLLLSGAAVSACRAFIMAALALIGIIVDRHHNSLRSISFAALVMLSCAPEVLLLPGFQMSFMAVIALISGSNFTSKSGVVRHLISITVGSLIASLVTAPYVIYHFNRLSLAGIAANMIAVPLTTFVVIPFGIAYLLTMNIVPIGGLLAHVVESSVNLVLHTARYFSRTKLLLLTPHSISPASVLIVTLGILLLCWWRGNMRLIIGGSLILIGVILASFNNTPDVLAISNGVVARGDDKKLHFVMRAGSTKGLTYSAWARGNGQVFIDDYPGQDRKLVCEDGGCIYQGRVLFSCDRDFILEHCKKVDLVIQGGDGYPALCDGVRHVSHGDFSNYGAHYLWIRGDYTVIKRARTNRPWHLVRGFVQRHPAPKKPLKCLHP